MKLSLRILSILMCGIWLSSSGQKAGNESYNDILKENDIILSLPSGFKLTDLGKDNPIGLTINPDYVPKYGFTGRNIGWTYSLGLKSENEDCLSLYSTIVPEFVSLSSIVEDEIQASMSDSDLDITDRIKMFTGNDMSEYADADTVLIYDLELKVPFLGKYSHATGIYLQKYAHPAMMLKVLMDEEGIKDKTNYIKTILGTIKYGDSATKDGLAGEAEFHTPIKYPRPKETDVFARCFMLENPIKVPENSVRLIKPEGFHKVPEQLENVLSVNPDYMPLDALSEESRVLYIPTVVLESDSMDCVFLYPSVDLSFSLNYNPAKIELQAIAGNEDLNVDNQIEKVALEDMSKYSNADTVFIYRMELKQPYLGRYKHCTGIVMKKYAHPGMAMKIITSDAGLDKLDRYMRMLFDSVLYDDEITETGIEAEETRTSLEKHGPCIHLRQAREKNKARKDAEKEPQN